MPEPIELNLSETKLLLESLQKTQVAHSLGFSMMPDGHPAQEQHSNELEEISLLHAKLVRHKRALDASLTDMFVTDDEEEE